MAKLTDGWGAVNSALKVHGQVVVADDYNEVPLGCDCAVGDLDLFMEYPPQWFSKSFTLKKGKKFKDGAQIHELVRKGA